MIPNIVNGEMQALKEYVAMLERENRAIAIERDTVYRELDAVNAELRTMDRLYEKNRQLREEVRRLNEINYHQNNKIVEMAQICQELERQRNEVESMNSQKHIFQQKIDNLQRTCNSLIAQNSSLQTKIKPLQNQLNSYQLKNDELKEQIQTIKLSIDNIEKERSKSAVVRRQKQLYERKLEELATNYYKVEAILIQKQNQNAQLNFELSQACHELEKQGQEYETMKQMLTQRDIMIDCLENQLEQLKTNIRRTVQQQIPEIESISKVDLIRQANILVERVNFLQKENRGYNQQVQQDSKTLLQLQELQMQYHNLMHNLAL